jgi:hypothetical protein
MNNKKKPRRLQAISPRVEGSKILAVFIAVLIDIRSYLGFLLLALVPVTPSRV